MLKSTERKTPYEVMFDIIESAVNNVQPFQFHADTQDMYRAKTDILNAIQTLKTNLNRFAV